MTNAAAPILRTPDHRFAALSDWAFAPCYQAIADPVHDSLRMHFVDEGARDGATVLLVHGEPTWG